MESSKRRILIFGGEGFVGRNISDYLGDYYDCFSVGIERSIFNERRKDKFIKGDPYAEIIENSYDVVIHLIDNKVELENFIEKEKKLIRNIDLNSKNHLILFSSAVVYANPESEYGQRKLELEKVYKKYCKESGARLTIFRLFNTFGNYQLPKKQGSLVANLFTAYLNGEPVDINDMSAKRDFIFAGDIGRFVKYSIDNSLAGTFDLASGKMIAINELVDIIERSIIKDKLSLVDKNKKETLLCPKASDMLLDKIEKTLFSTALCETYEFYKNNLNKIRSYAFHP